VEACLHRAELLFHRAGQFVDAFVGGLGLESAQKRLEDLLTATADGLSGRR